jgi:hypothetical protein
MLFFHGLNSADVVLTLLLGLVLELLELLCAVGELLPEGLDLVALLGDELFI